VGEDERMDNQGPDERDAAAEPVEDPTADDTAEGPAADNPAEPPVGADAGTESLAESGAEGEAAEPAGGAEAALPAEPDAAAAAGAEAAAATAPVEGKPRKKRRRWVWALSIIGVVIVVLVVAAFVTAHFTSASSFCGSCHEMEPYYQSWQASSHSSAECRDCHIPPGALPYVETKLGSFRELYVHFFGQPEAPLAVTRQIPNSSCLRCHEDPPPDPDLPTVTFSHEAHSNVDCISCHVRMVHTTVNPPEYQDPAAMSSCLECHNGSIAPNNCSYCHTAPHEARGECDVCHSSTSFSTAEASHPFELTGAHAGLKCTDCHVSKPGVETIPGTQLAKADPACVSCHGDHHGGLTDCAGCHTPSSWQNVDFEHPFPLVGPHAGLACADCHVSKLGGQTVAGTQFPAADPACVSCHKDQHGGLTDCAGCHTPSSWQNVDFKHPFPLIGAHAGLTCADCHVSKPGGQTVAGTQFPAAKTACVSCHGDHHNGLTNCARCHTPKGWAQVNFTHPSVGEHGRGTGMACKSCHPKGYGTHSCTCHGGNPPSGD
jgi:nitrate/TMAO reductase-like tetraheme cytochrome c subunit